MALDNEEFTRERNMGEFFGKLAEELLEGIKKNYRKPKLWMAIFLIFIIIILFLPYIDTNFFYFRRMENRIDILDKLAGVNVENIEKNDVLMREYQSLLQEMEENRERLFDGTIQKNINIVVAEIKDKVHSGNPSIKFASGAFWGTILLLWIPFMNTFQKKSDKVIAFFTVLICTVLLGYIAILTPIIGTPLINYICIPLVQLIIVAWMVIKSDKQKKTE